MNTSYSNRRVKIPHPLVPRKMTFGWIDDRTTAQGILDFVPSKGAALRLFHSNASKRRIRRQYAKLRNRFPGPRIEVEPVFLAPKSFDRIIDLFPKIKQFALDIAYDNGIICRELSEKDYLDKCNEILESDGCYLEDHVKLEEWLTTLTPDEMTILAGGEESEVNGLRQRCPLGGPDNLPLCDIGEAFFEA